MTHKRVRKRHQHSRCHVLQAPRTRKPAPFAKEFAPARTFARRDRHVGVFAAPVAGSRRRIDCTRPGRQQMTPQERLMPNDDFENERDRIEHVLDILERTSRAARDYVGLRRRHQHQDDRLFTRASARHRPNSGASANRSRRLTLGTSTVGWSSMPPCWISARRLPSPRAATRGGPGNEGLTARRPKGIFRAPRKIPRRQT